jgi:hypothetical protein
LIERREEREDKGGQGKSREKRRTMRIDED